MDLIQLLVPHPGGVAAWNGWLKAGLRTASPHYCFARGVYDVQATFEWVPGACVTVCDCVCVYVCVYACVVWCVCNYQPELNRTQCKRARRRADGMQGLVG